MFQTSETQNGCLNSRSPVLGTSAYKLILYFLGLKHSVWSIWYNISRFILLFNKIHARKCCFINAKKEISLDFFKFVPCGETDLSRTEMKDILELLNQKALTATSVTCCHLILTLIIFWMQGFFVQTKAKFKLTTKEME